MARLRLVALLCLAAALTAPCGSAPAKPSPAKQHAAPVSALARATAPTPTPSLTLNVTELSAAGQWLTVTWANISAPCASDFLALLPDGADIGDTSPLKMRPTGGVSHGNARCVRVLHTRSRTLRAAGCATGQWPVAQPAARSIGHALSSRAWVLHGPDCRARGALRARQC